MQVGRDWIAVEVLPHLQMPGKEQAVWKGIGNAVADLAPVVGPVVHKSRTPEACTAAE